MKKHFQIELTRGFVSLLDEDDWVIHSKDKFYAKSDKGLTYAARNEKPRTGRTLRLHRLVMNCPDGLEVDHINGDTLDNRKHNLRICTRMQNNRNAKQIRATLKGAYLNEYNRWIARITIKGKPTYIGSFATELEAHDAFKEAAVKRDGEFFRFN